MTNLPWSSNAWAFTWEAHRADLPSLLGKEQGCVIYVLVHKFLSCRDNVYLNHILSSGLQKVMITLSDKLELLLLVPFYKPISSLL